MVSMKYLVLKRYQVLLCSKLSDFDYYDNIFTFLGCFFLLHALQFCTFINLVIVALTCLR
jgi:hypothetical protein